MGSAYDPATLLLHVQQKRNENPRPGKDARRLTEDSLQVTKPRDNPDTQQQQNG